MRKKYIKTLLFGIALILANTLSAQLNINNVDQRLIDLYGTSRVQQMLADQPQFIDYMNYYVKNGYQIMTDIPARKLPYFKDISTITNSRTGKTLTADDLETLNILVLDIQRKPDEYLTYKVGETGTVVVFVAPKNLLEEYKMYKNWEGSK